MSSASRPTGSATSPTSAFGLATTPTLVNGLTPPAVEFRVELTAPSGDTWTWGPDDATQRVAGPALDFCFLVTQRRHRDDLAVSAEGSDAEHWLTIAQAFAGPPGAGRVSERST